jgi:hypothetical protein
MLFLAIAAIGAGPDTVHIGGSSFKGGDFTVAQLQQQVASEIKPVQYNSHGAPHTFNCVPLASVLKAAGAQTDFVMKPGADPKTKYPQLRQAVIVTGRDGYAVVFSLAEILPMVGDRAVWVALDEDGKPLSDSDGPVRLIIPDDKMPVRAVHEIASIDLVDIAPPTTEPANP